MNKFNEYIEIVLNKSRNVLKDKDKDTIDDEEVRKVIKDIIFKETFVEEINIKDIGLLMDTVFYKMRRRLGILEPLLQDDSISEIMVNGPNNIFIDKNGKLKKYEISFSSIKELEDIMQNISGDVHREINEMNPIVDCRLKDGSRVNGVFKNVAVNGPILTIRKFQDNFMNMENLIENGTVTREISNLLRYLVIAKYNIFISGGTSSGKTTFLSALADSIPKNERVIVIEDSMELKLSTIENIVHMETRKGNSNGQGVVTMSDLIKTSLRMRPDRIIVGEIRSDEIIPMIQAMNTGHNGSLSTGHSNSVQGMLKRMETMYLSSLPIAIDAIRMQIAEGIDIMVHVERMDDGSRKVIDVSELLGYVNGEFIINKLATYTREKGLILTGNHIKNVRKILLKGESFINELRHSNFID